MYRHFTSMLLYLTAAVLSAVFLLQLLLWPHIGSAVSVWPFVLSAMGCTAAFLWRDGEDNPQRQWQLPLSALTMLGFSPFWMWTFSAVRFSPGSWWYFCLMLLLSMGAAIWHVSAFSARLCEFCRNNLPIRSQILSSAQMIGWLYLMTVPVLSVFVCLMMLYTREAGLAHLSGLVPHSVALMITGPVIPKVLAGLAVFNFLLTSTSLTFVLVDFCLLNRKQPE